MRDEIAKLKARQKELKAEIYELDILIPHALIIKRERKQKEYITNERQLDTLRQARSVVKEK